MWELLAPQKKSLAGLYLGTYFTCYLSKTVHSGKQVIKQRMGVGRGYRETYVRCMCLALVLNQKEPRTLSLICFDSAASRIFTHSFIHLYAHFFICYRMPAMGEPLC